MRSARGFTLLEVLVALAIFALIAASVLTASARSVRTASQLENKTLAMPSSVDSIPTNADQEDHVSMGMHSARNALRIARNISWIFAIELMAACQAIDIQNERRKLGKGTSKAYDLLRSKVPFAKEDREFRHDIANISKMIRSTELTRQVESNCGNLKTH